MLGSGILPQVRSLRLSLLFLLISFTFSSVSEFFCVNTVLTTYIARNGKKPHKCCERISNLGFRCGKRSPFLARISLDFRVKCDEVSFSFECCSWMCLNIIPFVYRSESLQNINLQYTPIALIMALDVDGKNELGWNAPMGKCEASIVAHVSMSSDRWIVSIENATRKNDKR